MENDFYPIKVKEDIYQIDSFDTMYSHFLSRKNISKNILLHLLSGNPVVDLTDGEYVHWIQLDDEALKFAKNHIH